MGKATGFLEFERQTPSECEALERIKNWNEFSIPMDEEKLREQGHVVWIAVRHSVM